MSDYYLGYIFPFAGPFAPRDTKFCHGQILAISSYAALYSLLGTRYGGNGTTTFALPDLMGRVPIGPQNIGVSNRFGVEDTTLTTNNMPAHTHNVDVSYDAVLKATTDLAELGGNNTQNGDYIATMEAVNHPTTVVNGFSPSTAPGVDIAGASITSSSCTVSPVGQGAPFTNMQPTVFVNYVIVTDGLYPTWS